MRFHEFLKWSIWIDFCFLRDFFLLIFLVTWVIPQKVINTGVENFFLVARFFRRAILLARPIGQAKKWALKTKAHVQSRHNKKHSFLFFLTYIALTASLLMCFHQKFSQWGFYSLNVILMSKIQLCPRYKRKAKGWGFFKLLWGRGCKIRCASKNNFHNSNTSV